MKIGYFIKDHGETIEDTKYFTEEETSYISPDDYSYYAEDAAKYEWDRCDGWEWLESGVMLTLVIDNKEISDYEITVDFDPVFYADKK